jgi:DNA repair exonuclease SbcCD ATPase subunit
MMDADKRKKIYIFSGLGLLVAALITLVVLLLTSKQENEDLQQAKQKVEEEKALSEAELEKMFIDKEILEDEYADLAAQFDGFQNIEIHNDSLISELARERQRVQDLLEELRITKATDSRRIEELRKELATLRTIMVSYVNQIDSLDRTNKLLQEENIQVKQQYEEKARQAEKLEQERAQLVEVVTRASMLELSDFEVVKLNHRDRKTTFFSQIQKLEFKFNIARNITTEPGTKTMYLRITSPNGEVMQKTEDDVFPFENQDIAYSVAKEFEYEGESVSIAMYWSVEEILEKGLYNADFFVDGQLIGSFPFTLK